MSEGVVSTQYACISAIQCNVIIHLSTGINMLTVFLKYHHLDHPFASAKLSNA